MTLFTTATHSLSCGVPALLLCLLTTCPALALALANASGQDHSSTMQLNQSPAEVVFSPHQSPMLQRIRSIDAAKQSVLLAAYAFSHKDVAVALQRASKRGVRVFVVADAGSAKQGYSAIQFLANESIPVRINERYAILHHKFAGFDERDVWTGSENFTSSAKKRNAGNALLLRNQPQLAKQYGLEWRRLWYEGSDVTPKY